MNVTYKDLKDGYILKEGDAVVIHGAKHHVSSSISRREYFLDYDGVSNDALDKERIPSTVSNEFIFYLLHISDKNSFVKDIAGKDFSGIGSFPQVKTLEALTKVAIALLEKPLYNIGDYVTIREEIEGHEYSLTYWDFMKVFVGKTLAVTKIESKSGNALDKDSEGEIYVYELDNNFVWDIAMIMPATEEEKKSLDVPDREEPEEKEEEKIHYVTLEYLKEGYIFKESDHIRINGIDCIIHTSTDDKRFWLSSDIEPEFKIYESLGIPEDKKKELAKLYGSVDVSFHSPEFSSLERLSNFVKKILMYKKEDEKPSKKKWFGNPTYFDLIDGRILEKGDILNIHGIEYRVTDGGSDSKRCWLDAPGVRNSVIFDKLRIDDKSAFVKGICPTVSTVGDFPEVGSYEDLTKVAIALYEVPEFKVGDKVRVAHREDKEGDYPWYFTDEMLALRDKVFTIMAVDVCGYSFSGKAYDRLRKDPHCYYLDDEGNDFQWHSSMLEKVSESDKKSDELPKGEFVLKPSRVCPSDLQSGYTLKTGDTVVICGETYEVYGPDFCFLYNIGGPNRNVFDKLGIKDKMSFCSQFGRVSSGDFPEFYRLEDLTACVKQLMLLEELRSGCKGDSGDKPLPEVIKAERFNFAMDISEPDEPSDTGTVRLPEIKDDFKIIL